MEFTSHPEKPKETVSAPAALTWHIFFSFPEILSASTSFYLYGGILSSEKEGTGSSRLLLWGTWGR